jgi:AcrR family transcriptional regulator
MPEPVRRERRKPGLERLLTAADEVFYEEGTAATAVERLLEKSGVARGTLYGNFRSKTELVDAYLARRHQRTLAAIEDAMSGVDRSDPSAVFAALISVGEQRSEAGTYRGCAFALAVAEMPEADGPAVRWARTHKSAIKELLATALTGKVDDPTEMAEALLVLYDGALLSAALRPGERSFAAALRTGLTILERAR